MLSLILTGLAVVAAVSGNDCEHASCDSAGHIKYYKELHCLPVQESGACCPSRFDCTAALAKRVPNKCHVNGHSYDQGTTLSDEQIGYNCIGDCHCSKDGNEAKLECQRIECAELFSPLTPGCTRLYAADRCCSVSQHCPNATNPTGKEAFTCQHAGKSYIVGQKFWPEEKPCLSCICQEGYDGTLNGPWCTENKCNIEVTYSQKIKEGCAPVYYGSKGCCPSGWRCPKASDTVVTNSGAEKDAPQCTFGTLQLKLSEKLNTDKKCEECTCSVPPHVSCVYTYNC